MPWGLVRMDGGLAEGAEVDHYRVIRSIGKGGMGEVFLARDTRLGRRVALKVVRPERLGNEEAVERFLFEAKATARFNHPHIVTIYAVGEHEGRPYLALEYLEGHSLRERLKAEQPGIREALRLGAAVADALTEAHRHNVLHRDLKPDNVLIPRDGRPRVVDFGLAKVSELPRPRGDSGVSNLDALEGFETLEQGRIHGTPPYMAPEQWTEDKVSPATDIFALGVMLYEMLCGRRPYESFETSHAELCMQVINPAPAPPLESGREIPDDVRDLVERCLRKSAVQRPTAEEVRADLQHLLAAGRGRISAEEGPYRGLESFDERHAASFFGRDEEIAGALERLREVPVLPVVGPSGAGKSSFVAAGVIPRLREQGPWTVVLLRPGGDPFHALAARLADGARSTLVGDTVFGEDSLQVRPEPRPDVSEQRTASQSGVPGLFDDSAASLGDVEVPSTGSILRDARRLARVLRDQPQQLTLLLQRIAESRRSRVLLVVDQLEELYTLIEDDEVRRAFMRAICLAADDPLEPVRVVLTLRDDFLGRLAETAEAREVLGRVMVLRSPGTEALREILVRPLDIVDYRFEDPALVSEMVAEVDGEPAGLPLLQFAARMMWDRRDRDATLLTRAVHDAIGGVAGALADHADGVLAAMTPRQEQHTRDILLRLVTPDRTRRTVPVSRVLEGLGDEAAAVLRRLTDARLLTVHKGGEEVGESALVELSHESLVQRWGRLARWIEQSSEDLAFLAEVERAAELWDGRGRRDEEVWAGEALTEALRSLERCDAPVPERVHRFLDAGRDRAARQQRARQRRRTGAIAVLVVLLVAATVVAVAYINKAREAVDGRNRAEEREAEALREAALAAEARGDPLEARAKLRSSLELRDSPMGRALWWRLARDPQRWVAPFAADTYEVAFSPDGRTIAVACMDRAVYLVDTETRNVTQVLRGHPDQVYTLEYTPDGGLVSADWAGNLRVWDVERGTARGWKTPGLFNVAISPDGRFAAGGGGSRALLEYDLETQALREYCCHDSALYRVGYSPDGRYLASTGPDLTIRVWDRESGEQVQVLRGHDRTTAAVEFLPDGRRLVSASGDQTLRIWDVETGEVLRVLRGHTNGLHAVSISPDGGTIVSAGSDTTLRVWRTDAAAVDPLVLRGHTASVYSVDVHPDGRRVVSSALDGTVRLWDTAGESVRRESEGHRDMVSAVAADRAGRFFASSASDGTVRVWDAVDGRQLQVLEGHGDEVFDVAIAPDGETLASIGHDGTVRTWQVGTGTPTAVLTGHTRRGTTIAYHPDGTRLVSGSSDRSVRLWDLETGGSVGRYEGPTAAHDVAFRPDGEVLAVGFTNGEIHLLDAHSLDPTGTVLGAVGDPIWGVAWSPDGALLASSNEAGVVRVWDVRRRTVTFTSEVDLRVYRIDWHPDGRRLGLPQSDNTTRILDIETGAVVVLGPQQAEVGAMVFTADGRHALTACDDGSVQLWDPDLGTPVWRAPVLEPATLSLWTHAGWVSLADGSVAREPPRGEWVAAVEDQALQGDVAGDTLCLRTRDDRVMGWSLSGDRRWLERKVADLERVVAVADGCVCLAAGAVELHQAADRMTWVGQGARAVSKSAGEILVATADEVRWFGADGTERGRVAVAPGVTAMLRLDDALVLGFDNGNVEVRGADAGVRSTLEGTPAVPAVRLIEGPSGTLAAGFADGTVGLWLAADGAELDRTELHGAVEHLLIRDGVLHVATVLGGFRAIDLGVFDRPRCDLLREIWAQVPVAWIEGAAQERPPPDDHACR